jgi:hypothetical protein
LRLEIRRLKELKVFNSLRLSVVVTTEVLIEVFAEVLADIATDILAELASRTEMLM